MNHTVYFVERSTFVDIEKLVYFLKNKKVDFNLNILEGEGECEKLFTYKQANAVTRNGIENNVFDVILIIFSD